MFGAWAWEGMGWSWCVVFCFLALMWPWELCNQEHACAYRRISTNPEMAAKRTFLVPWVTSEQHTPGSGTLVSP
jgi:hypothetical protein